ncbi:MAG: minor capsid protein [Clostridiales Family XIII bacterium]|nr:minor capsid protein [Clostridiales Family XIII bacterium]
MQIMPDIDRIYKQAQADIEKEIRAWYQRMADNNGVSMTEARKLLTANELKEFHWSVEEYIKRGEENAIDQRWMKQLENASARVHISRLEALKLQVQQSVESVYGNQLDQLDESMRKLYQDGYYRTAYELQKGFGIGWPIASIDQNKLDKIIAKPWASDGKNFSSRIWGNRTKLVNELHTELSRMCLTGAAPERAIRNIAKKMHTSKYNAGTLVMTEAAAFGSAAQADCFNDLGVEEYEICATLDSQTSEICRGLDGKVYGMKDYEVGVTAPPFHVKCRTCTCPHFDDEFTVGEMRAARGENGKTYYVPADMKYPEWKESFVSSADEGDISNFAKTLLTGNIKKKVELFKNKLPATENKHLRELLSQSLERTKFKAGVGPRSKYRNGVVLLGDKADFSTIAHELLHEIDDTYGVSKNNMLKESIQSDWENLKKMAGEYGDSVTEMLYLKYPQAFYSSEHGSKLVYMEYRGISDILNGMSMGSIRLGFRHRNQYWQNAGKLEKETWAQLGRIVFENNTDVLIMTKQIFPNSYNEFLSIIKKMVK